MEQAIISGWTGLLRTFVVAVLAYVTLIAFLRVSGKRTLSKMNAFDLVVTVALGSTLATVLLNKNVALAEGAVAFASLIGLQYVITWTSVRFKTVSRMVKSEPTLLLYDGRFIERALISQRVTREEVLASLRSSGVPSAEGAGAVVLETDGSMSIIRRDSNVSVLPGVKMPDYLDAGD